MQFKNQDKLNYKKRIKHAFPRTKQKTKHVIIRKSYSTCHQRKGGYMNSLKMNEIDERIIFLQNLVQAKHKEVKKAPKGILNIARAGNRVQYYFKNSSKDKVRKYLKKSQSTLIKALCQKDYDERVIEAAKKELTHLKRLQNHYKKGDCEAIYEKIIFQYLILNDT